MGQLLGVFARGSRLSRFMAFVLVAFAPAATFAQWTTQLLDPAAGWRVSVINDYAGKAHVAYSRENNTLALRDGDGGTWSSPDIWSNSSTGRLVLDRKGQQQLITKQGQDLILATRDVQGNWTKSIIATGAIDPDADVAFDALNHPYVAYVDTTSRQLKVATLSGNVWTSKIVNSGPQFQFANLGTHIAASLDGSVYLTYGDAIANVMRFAAPSGAGWSISTFASGPAGSTGLVFDKNEVLHMGYSVDFGSGTYYATYNGSSWSSDKIWPATYPPSLAFDAAGAPHLAFISPHGFTSSQQLFVATKPGAVWNTPAIDTWNFAYDGPQATAISLNRAGDTTIIYGDAEKSVNVAQLAGPTAQGNQTQTPIFDGQAISNGGSFFINSPGGNFIEQYHLGSTERRGVMEFDLSHIPHETIHTVELQLEILGSASGGGLSSSIDIYGYAGNGSPNIGGASNLTRVIGTSGPLTTGNIVHIYLDPAYVESLRDAGHGLGLVVVAGLEGFQSFIAGMQYAQQVPGIMAPTLTITYAPEPASLLLVLLAVPVLYWQMRRNR